MPVAIDTTEVAPRFAFALSYVSDIEAARRFYVEVLGMDVRRSHPNYIEFDTFAIASDESMSGTRDTELYWLVDDIEAAYEWMSRRAPVGLPPTSMPFGRLFSVYDPDGRPRFVLELAKERPSQPVPPDAPVHRR